MSVIKSSRRSPVDAPIIGGGMGSTGTSSLAMALYRLGIIARHGTGTTLIPKGKMGNAKWALGRDISNVKAQYERKDSTRCHSAMDGLDFKLQRGEAVLDEPAPEAFIDLWGANPDAKVILTVRPADAWVKSRRRKSAGVRPPVQRPCGYLLSDIASDAHAAALFTLHNQLVRCVIPRKHLLEINLVRNRTAVMERLAGFLHVNLTRLPAEARAYPRVSAERLENFSNVLRQEQCGSYTGNKRASCTKTKSKSGSTNQRSGSAASKVKEKMPKGKASSRATER